MLALVAALVSAVAPIGGGNALTLPAARHMVRIDPGGGRAATWFVAIQQDGAQGRGLGLWRSDDEARTWSYYAPIQPDWSERDTPDLVAVGNDIALVYSYEGPTLGGSSRHDVYFQWWRWDGARGWNASPPAIVFDSTSNATAFYRGELAIDSLGRIWVHAFKLESDGSHTAAVAVSTDGGASFARQPDLARTSTRSGGRILGLGSTVIFLWGTHGCCDPGRMRVRNDSDPLSAWSAAASVLPEGLYHGAALSAAADGAGGMHLVYKDLTERLYYRRFDGSGWSGRTQLEAASDWATQPAITRLGSDLAIFYNHPVSSNTDYRWMYRTLHAGSISSAQTLDGSSGFKGYPASAESLPTWFAQVPCVFGKTPNASSTGDAVVVFGSAPAPSPGGGSDGGTPAVDAGMDAGSGGADAGAPDAGADAGSGGADAGAPDAGADGGTGGGGVPVGGTLLFSDDFQRNDASGLGPRWTVTAGGWITDSRANADRNTRDLAVVNGVSCTDCRIDARMVGFGTAETALTLRGQANGDRYDLIVASGGRLRIRRWRNGAAAVLGDVASGIADLGEWAAFTFAVSGANPVTLTGSVNGVAKLSVSDSTAQAIVGAGSAGLGAVAAGVWFDDFRLTAVDGGGTGGGGGATDGGSVDGGTPDSGTTDGGTTDAGAIDGGATDGGTPDAGGAPGGSVLFSDDFNRNDGQGLGPAWTIAAGYWITDSRANADRNQADQAYAKGIVCADCRIDARLVGFGTELAVVVRGSGAANGDRYDAAITSGGRLRIRRWRGGTATVLGDVASGIPDLGGYAAIAFTVSGTAPVTLSAAVNGTTRLTVVDGSSQAIGAAGAVGITANAAGVWFDDFKVTAVGR